MSDLADDVAEQQANRADEWREVNEFAIVHPDGWTIARYTVMGQVTHLLWDAAGNARGPFNDMELAKAVVRPAAA
jgi:hypothetical protein